MTKEELESKIEQLESQIYSLENEVSDLKDELEDARDDVDAYKDERDDYYEKLDNSLEWDGSLEMQYKIEAFKENHERFTSAEFEKLMKSYIR